VAQPGRERLGAASGFRRDECAAADDLREALNAQSQRVWRQLKPQGAINLTASLDYLTAAKTPKIEFAARPVDDTTAIEPAMFPYRLERLHGELVYHEGHIDLRGIHAVHDRTTVEANGACDFDHEGNWRLQFKQIASIVCGPIATCSPPYPAAEKSVVSLNPTGTININGGILEFNGNSIPAAPVRSAWNLPFAINQGTIGNGIRFEILTASSNDRRLRWPKGPFPPPSSQSIRSRSRTFQFTNVRRAALDRR